MSPFYWILFGVLVFVQPILFCYKKYGSIGSEALARFIYDMSLVELIRVQIQISFGLLCMLYGWMRALA